MKKLIVLILLVTFGNLFSQITEKTIIDKLHQMASEKKGIKCKNWNWNFLKTEPIQLIITYFEKEKLNKNGIVDDCSIMCYYKTHSDASDINPSISSGSIFVNAKLVKNEIIEMNIQQEQASFTTEKMDVSKLLEFNEIEDFWKKFQSAVKSNNKNEVVSMFNFPFDCGSYKNLDILKSPNFLMKNYDKLFNKEVCKAIDNSILSMPFSALEYSQWEEGDRPNIGDIFQIMKYSNKIGSESGIFYYFIVRKVNNAYKIFSIGNAA